MKQLKDIEVGKTFLGNDGIERIILEHFPDGKTLTLTRDRLFKSVYGENNDYKSSKIKKLLENEITKLEKTFGKENLNAFKINLLSEDGLDTYGEIETKCGLLTAEQYRKYTRIIEQYHVGSWWLATPDSTTERSDSLFVSYVHACGFLICSRCYVDRDCFGGCGDGIGVRAVCLFNSNIFVSE